MKVNINMTSINHSKKRKRKHSDSEKDSARYSEIPFEQLSMTSLKFVLLQLTSVKYNFIIKQLYIIVYKDVMNI